jgi:hypothetical protein
MEDAAALESHLREAPIDLYGHFPGGGGHADKQLVVVRGGIGALAKLARNEQEARQCRFEVGVYQVAKALEWGDLVPATVLREVPTATGVVEAGVQILWPAFATAAEAGVTEASVDERDSLRAAIIDALVQNSDRHTGNWGVVAGAKLGLIDHGHTALSRLPGVSGFALMHRDAEISGELHDRLEEFVNGGAEQLDGSKEATPPQSCNERIRCLSVKRSSWRPSYHRSRTRSPRRPPCSMSTS